MAPVVAQPPSAIRKKLVRRAGPDRSQTLRRAVQLAFFALNAWIGIEFYLFVRYYETGGRSVWAARPPGVEGWLPIASLMNLKVLLLSGQMPRLHPAGMFLLIAFLAASWIFRKSFCGWLCPVGTASEYLWKLGRQTFGRNFRLPRKLDIGLRSLKYLLLALFLYAVGSMSVPAIRAFLEGPYGIVDDVKMLNFFRFLGLAGGIVVALLVVASVFVQNFWCRYLCPYGALMGLVSLASPLRIRRDASLCIDCAKCAKACPAALPVDKLIAIRSAECIGCLECVAECPAAGALMMAAPHSRRVPAWAMAAGVAVLFLGICGVAQWAGYWRTDLSSDTYFRLIPHANEFTHPR
jgi:polyferredoxin